MKRSLTPAEIARKFEEINSRTPAQLSPEDEAALAEAEAMDDGTTVSLEELKRELGGE